MKQILTFACFFALYSANAQQVPQFSQYLRNQYLVNPAAAGVYDFVDVTVGGRLQWLGFDDAPKHRTYMYQHRFQKRREHVTIQD